MTLQTVLILLVTLFIYLFVRSAIARLVANIGAERHIAPARIQYVKTAINFAWAALAIVTAGIVTGFGYQDLGVFLGSALAIFGIALVAQWSILSNITASIFVFFFFPYRVGNYVRIVDGDNSVEGVIKEITLFHVILQDGEVVVTYPNSLVFQKAVKISPNGKPPTTSTIETETD